MTKINVEDVKKETSEFYQIPIFDEKMTFYYDRIELDILKGAVI